MKFPPGPHGINWPPPYDEEPMLALADRIDCYAYNFDVDHADHVIADLRSAAKALRAAAQSSGVREEGK